MMVRNPNLLRQMLQAVLGVVIVELEIKNPEIPGDLSPDKQIALDVRARDQEGRWFDVEMQTYGDPALAERLLFNWARLYSSQLGQGERYSELKPTYTIVWCLPVLFPQLEKLHSVFEARDTISGELFSEHLQIHLLQLAKLGCALDTNSEVTRWARFFVARTQQELQALAAESATMEEAKNTLDELSNDRHARWAAEDRARSQATYRARLDKAAADGRSEGRLAGRQQMLLEVLTQRFGELPLWVQQRVEAATTIALSDLAAGAVSEPTVESVFEKR